MTNNHSDALIRIEQAGFRGGTITESRGAPAWVFPASAPVVTFAPLILTSQRYYNLRSNLTMANLQGVCSHAVDS